MVAANETCPQPQTREHLMALEIAGIENIVIVQNKIDLVNRERAIESHEEIRTFLEGTIAENAPIIPVSAHHDVNLDILIGAIEHFIPTPNREEEEKSVMHIARSFDINRPGTRPAKIKGGVIGGSIVSGTFEIGDEIEIGPGRKIEKGNKSHYKPILTKVITMKGGGKELDSMHAGGLCGMATPLDPVFTTADNLSGQVVAKRGQLPPVRESMKIKINLMKEMVGGDSDTPEKVAPLQGGEMLMVNVSTATSVGIVSNVGKGEATLSLRLPVVTEDGARVSLSRRVGTRWRLIGYGVVA